MIILKELLVHSIYWLKSAVLLEYDIGHDKAAADNSQMNTSKLSFLNVFLKKYK